MHPRDAFFAQTENVKFKEAVGRISAELVTPYRRASPPSRLASRAPKRTSTTDKRS
jgi:hypothetical protein